MFRLIFLITAFSICVTAAQAKRVALIIGNSQYTHTEPLANPAHDARAMAAALQRLEFEVSVAINLGQTDFRTTVRDFLRAARGAEIATVFYAGHALQAHDSNYLLPIDARLETTADVRLETIALADIVDPLTELSGTVLVFLDACRNNPLAETMRSAAGTRSAGAARGLALMRTGSGTLLAFAAAPGEVAYDGAGTNSPFTEALLRHIEQPGLEIRQVMTRVRADVEEATNRSQTPWDNSSLKGDVFLAAAVAPELQPQVQMQPQAVPQAAPQTAAAAPVDNTAQIAWDTVKSMDPGPQQRRAAELFLQRFGDSAYGFAAQLMLDSYGTNTAAVVRERSIAEEPEPTPEAEPALALSRRDLRKVQQGLNLLGYNAGPEDGLTGARTRAAVSAWQTRKGHEATGALTRDQHAALMAAAAPLIARAKPKEPEKKGPSLSVELWLQTSAHTSSPTTGYRKRHTVALANGAGNLHVPVSVAGAYFGPFDFQFRKEGEAVRFTGRIKKPKGGWHNFSGTIRLTNGAGAVRVAVTSRRHMTVAARYQ